MSDTEKRFVEAVHDLLRRRDELAWDEILSELEDILTWVRAEVDDTTFEEARCRIAEDKLLLATLKGYPIERCEGVLVELLQWPDASVRRLDQIGAFARYCLEQGQPGVGHRYLLDAFNGTDWSTTIRPQEDRAQCEGFLAELSRASGPSSEGAEGWPSNESKRAKTRTTWFGCKSLYVHAIHGTEPEHGSSLIEERVVLIRATSADEALVLGEQEARKYAAEEQICQRVLDYLEVYDIGTDLSPGTELFSRLFRAPDADDDSIIDRLCPENESLEDLCRFIPDIEQTARRRAGKGGRDA